MYRKGWSLSETELPGSCKKLDEVTIFSKFGWGDNIFESWMTRQYFFDTFFCHRRFCICATNFQVSKLSPLSAPHTRMCASQIWPTWVSEYFLPRLLSGWRAWIFFSWMQENSVKDPACLKESFSRHVTGTQGRENNGGNVFGQRGSREARRTSLTAPTFGRCSHNNRSDAWIPICSRKGDMRTINIC